METTGPLLPGSAVDGGGADTAWTNPSNADTEDDTYAVNTWALAGLESNPLECTDYGFNVPDNAVIDGVVMTLVRKGVSATDTNIQLIKDGSATGDDKSANTYPASTDSIDYGGSEDLWGVALTPDDVNSSDFGVSVSAGNTGGGGSGSIDAVHLTIHWHYDLDVAPAEVPKRHTYKVYDAEDTFIGSLPDVESEFAFSQDINTVGSQITVRCAVSPDSSSPILTQGGQPAAALMRNGNRVVVNEYSYYYPNGRVVFKGQINRVRASFGGTSTDSMSATVVSDGLDMDQFVARGGPFTYTYDISQNPADDISFFNMNRSSKGAEYDNYGQTFQTGASVTDVSIIGLKLRGAATVTVSLYASTGGALIGSTTRAVDTNGIPSIEYFIPATPLEVSSSTTYYIEASVGAGETIKIYYSASNPYASGAAYSAISGGGAPVYTEQVGDDFTFYVGQANPTTTATYASKDPSTEILSPSMTDYNLRGGRIQEGDEIEATGLSLTYTFNTATMLEMLNKCLEMAPNGFYYTVDLGTNELKFKDTSSSADFTLVRGRHIESLNLVMSIESVKNYLLISGGDTGSGDNLLREYIDVDSIARYGLRSERKSDNRIALSATADAIGDSFIDEMAGEVQATTVTVLDRTMDILLLEPGKTIGFAGFDNFVDDLVLQIVRREVGAGTAELTLGELPRTAMLEIEQIRRGLIAEQTVDNPSGPS